MTTDRQSQGSASALRVRLHRMPYRMTTLAAILAVVLSYHGTVHAVSVPIDPDTGWSGYFAWDDGLGQIDDISLVEGAYDWVETEWSIALAEAGYLTLVTAYDGYMPGDEFALYVDGGHVPWTLEYHDVDGFYHGEHDHLSLSAGSHSITFYVTAVAPGTGGMGAGMAEFSPAVPEPVTVALLGIGALVLVRRRR
jgi:hypothetical protein